jgi:hypothetical protein
LTQTLVSVLSLGCGQKVKITNQAGLTMVDSGCGVSTAKAENVTPGVSGSRHIAQIDFARVNALKARFDAAAAATGMPRALLAPIASRESHCGAILDHNVEGDGGEAFGIMQVDNTLSSAKGAPRSPKPGAH